MEKAMAVMRVESWSVKDGMLLLEINEHALKTSINDIISWCQQKYNSYVEVELSPPYKPKTQKELGKFFAMCTEYGRFRGMTKQEVAEVVKYRAMDEGLWRAIEIPFSTTGKTIPASIATANTKELSVLIEVLYRIAAEDGYLFREDR
ncbi:hypothetical protein SAMN04487977_101550 [Treponema bryantii]|uniref:Uncharacterized protein n=1 Tax=Treponema bryantii TaxID=163 RepID=A0A1H9B452_9SPIR|nr:hypothetical protein [Treponema bryantii]SEP83018.1 hypothetical protein SAMN04487977_101550 [Treponema bryantii]